MQCMDHPLASYSKPDQEGVHRLEWNMISIDQVHTMHLSLQKSYLGSALLKCWSTLNSNKVDSTTDKKYKPNKQKNSAISLPISVYDFLFFVFCFFYYFQCRWVNFGFWECSDNAASVLHLDEVTTTKFSKMFLKKHLSLNICIFKLIYKVLYKLSLEISWVCLSCQHLFPAKHQQNFQPH